MVDEMMNVPTMRGFAWSPRQIESEHRQLPGNLWCVGDAFCALMGWAPGSDEWNAFIEAPAPDDMGRLIDYLGLVWFDPDFGPHQAAPAAALDHPGITCYKLHRLRMSHCLYQRHVRHLRPLPAEYWLVDPDPELFQIVIDLRQPPRGLR
jgi:hypothetical protein